MDFRYKQIENTLLLVEDAIVSIESNVIPNYSKECFRAVTQCFMSVAMDMMWQLQEKEPLMELEDKMNMAKAFGSELQKLIKIYTNIDTHDFYK